MRIESELKDIPLPETYFRNQRECYLDPYRKRLIEITPEETVRQRVAKYCEMVLGVPPEFLLLEVPMSRYAEGVAGRADIIVHMPIDEFTMQPLLVIECKKSDVILSDKVVDQAVNYCDIIAADYFIVTNGIDAEIFKYVEAENTYKQLEKVLKYQEMVDKKGVVVKERPKMQRLTYEQLYDLKLLEDYESDTWVYGADTLPKNRPFVVNLYEGLMDQEHRLPKAKFKNFQLVEDIGVRFLDYSNAGAGHFFGMFRSFLIQESNGDSQIISLSIFGTTNNVPLDRVNTKRTSYSSMTVAVDKFKMSRTILEYNIDTYVSIQSKKACFLHSGRISSLPSKEVRDYMNENSELIEFQGDNMKLGEIAIDKLIYLDDQNTRDLMYTLIEYALLREKYRSEKKEKKKSTSHESKDLLCTSRSIFS